MDSRRLRRQRRGWRLVARTLSPRTDGLLLGSRLVAGYSGERSRNPTSSENSSRGGSSVGQSSGLIIRRSLVRVQPAPRSKLAGQRSVIRSDRRADQPEAKDEEITRWL